MQKNKQTVIINNRNMPYILEAQGDGGATVCLKKSLYHPTFTA